MDKEICLAVADQLAKVGIQCEVHPMEWNTYINKLIGHSFDGGLYY